MELQMVLCMNGGTNARSYANNSQLQEAVIMKAKPIIEESINHLYTASYPKTLRIADLGCSSGPNALLAISHVIDVINKIRCRKKEHYPQLQVFLNDLWGNDFNSIFMSLPTFYHTLFKDKGFDYGKCFIGAVPGSFYGRLFPNQSLDFVHSSYSLHWLSQVPEGLQNEVSVSLINKGNIYLAKTSPPLVIEAYQQQFHKDFSLFLLSRSEELSSGGRMVFTLLGRINQDPLSDECCAFWKLLSQALCDMASLGKIKREEVDTFNLPYYSPCIEEIKAVMETEGSFHLDRVETFKVNWDANGKDNNKSLFKQSDNKSRARNVRSCIRAVAEPLLTSKFGGAIMDDLFMRYEEKVGIHMASQKSTYTNLVVSVSKIG